MAEVVSKEYVDHLEEIKKYQELSERTSRMLTQEFYEERNKRQKEEEEMEKLKTRDNWLTVQRKYDKKLDKMIKKVLEVGKGRTLQSGIKRLCKVLLENQTDAVYIRPFYTDLPKKLFEEHREHRIKAKLNTIRDINTKIVKIRAETYSDPELSNVSQNKDEDNHDEVEKMIAPKVMDFDQIIDEAKRANEKICVARGKLDDVISSIPGVVRAEFNKQMEIEATRMTLPLKMKIVELELRGVREINIDYKVLYIDEVIKGNIMRAAIGEPTIAPIVIDGGILSRSGIGSYNNERAQVDIDNYECFDDSDGNEFNDSD